MAATTRTSGPSTLGPKARSSVFPGRGTERTGKSGRARGLVALAALLLPISSYGAGCLQPGTFDNEEQFRLKKPDAGDLDSGGGGSSASGGSGGSGGSSGSSGSGGTAGSPDDSGTMADTNQPPADSGRDTNQPPTGQTIWIEAESGTGLSAPLENRDGATASGSKLIATATGTTTNATPDSTTTGIVTYMFTVNAMATFKVWGRTQAISTNNDSFWVKMDQGQWIQWNNLPPTVADDWAWDDVHDTPAGDVTSTFMLSAGSHTLQIMYREADARLDKLAITSNANLVPTGMGQ